MHPAAYLRRMTAQAARHGGSARGGRWEKDRWGAGGPWQMRRYAEGSSRRVSATSNCRDGEGEAGKAHGTPPFSTNCWAIRGSKQQSRGAGDWCENGRRRINDEAQAGATAASARCNGSGAFTVQLAYGHGRRGRLQACPTLAMSSLDPDPLAVPRRTAILQLHSALCYCIPPGALHSGSAVLLSSISSPHTPSTTRSDGRDGRCSLSILPPVVFCPSHPRRNPAPHQRLQHVRLGLWRPWCSRRA
jgi:hypothetical protein